MPSAASKGVKRKSDGSVKKVTFQDEVIFMEESTRHSIDKEMDKPERKRIKSESESNDDYSYDVSEEFRIIEDEPDFEDKYSESGEDKLNDAEHIYNVAREALKKRLKYPCHIPGCPKSFASKHSRDRHSENPRPSIHKFTTEEEFEKCKNQMSGSKSKDGMEEQKILKDNEEQKIMVNESEIVNPTNLPFRFLPIEYQIWTLRSIGGF